MVDVVDRLTDLMEIMDSNGMPTTLETVRMAREEILRLRAEKGARWRRAQRRKRARRKPS